MSADIDTSQELRIFRANAYYIPIKDVSLRTQKKLISKFSYKFYEERACAKCENFDERHNDLCNECPSYLGTKQTAKIEVVKNKEFISIPRGGKDRMLDVLEDEGHENIRIARKSPPPTPFKRAIKFTGTLHDYQGPAVDVCIKKRLGILKSPPRSGKCVTGSTMISTNKGLIRIDSLFTEVTVSDKGETIWTAPKGLKVHTSEGFKPVSHLYTKKVDATVSIETVLGKKLEGTPNHPVRTVTLDGVLVWKPLSEIQPGDFVVSNASKSGWAGRETKLLAGIDAAVSRISEHATNLRIGRTPTVLTEDLCRVMGYLTADGRLSSPSSLGFCNSDEKKLELFQSVWSSCFPDHPLKRSTDDSRTPSLGTSCKFIRLFLEECCGFKLVLAGEKQIPRILLSAPRSHVLAFLEAYMTCDGEIGSSSAVFSSASFIFSRQLGHLLTALGFPNRMLTSPIEVQLNHVSKGVRMGYYGSVRLKRNVFDSLSSEFKSFYRKRLPARDSRMLDQSDSIPYLRKVLHTLTKATAVRVGQSIQLRTEKGGLTSLRPILDKRGSGRSEHMNRLSATRDDLNSAHPTVVDLNAVKQISTDCYLKAEALLDPNLRFEEVTSVSHNTSPTRVYDLSVPSNEQFFGNGILCHNTVMATHLVCRVGQKTLILAHQTEWLSQFRETFLGSDTQKGFTNARPHQIQICKTYEQFSETDVCLATFSTFMSEKGKALLRKIRNLFNVIIIDEVQGVPAKESSRVTAQFNFNILLGLSGTPARKRTEEWQLADDLVGPILVETSVPRLQPTVEVLETTKQEFKASQGQAGLTYLQSRLENNKPRRSVIIRDIIKRAKAGHLVLVPLTRVNSILSWTREINEQMETPGYALPFYGGLKKDMRMKIVEKARKFQCRVVIGNIALLSTGLNIPRASCLYEVGVNNNLPKAGQRFARILTPMEGKPAPVVVFTLDNCDIMRRCRQNEFWNCLIKEVNPRILPETKRALLSYFANTKKRKEMDDNSFLRDGL